MKDPRQELADHLQAALVLLARVRVTMEQQANDFAAVLAELERAAALLRTWRPPSFDGVPRHTANLELAILRTGHSLSNIAFLSGVPESRLHQLVSGTVPTTEERAALSRAIPDWMPGGAR
jgi:hypothetical protein